MLFMYSRSTETLLTFKAPLPYIVLKERGTMRTRLFLIASMASVLAFGQADDPPGRAARLGYLTGTGAFQPGSVEDWVPATLNRPLSTRDRLWTESGARSQCDLCSA